MATLLLFVIYIAFIGLGIPDSLFGTAWPTIYREFNLPISYQSFVTVIVSLCTVASSLMSPKLIARFGTGLVAAVSTLMTVIALLGFSLSGGFIPLILLAVPLGLGAGAIDVSLNNYVALHYSATHMSFLHCFYGIGVTLSPFVLSLVINGSGGWRSGYRIAVIIQSAIAALLFITLPLWKKANCAQSVYSEPEPKVLSTKETMTIPGLKGMCILFVCSCAIENTCGSWGSTFLVEAKGMDPQSAAGFVTFYYMGMALGRFLSGILALRFHSRQIIRISKWVLGAAILVLLLPFSGYMSAIGLFLVGLGNGPMYPNLNYLAPEIFGKDVSQSVISVQMSASYLGILIAPALFGLIGQHISIALFPAYLAFFYVILTFLLLHMRGYLLKKPK